MYLSYNEFVCTLSKVTSATSVTGQKYYDIHVIDNLICGKRGIGTSFQIKLAKLYNAYIDLPIINTYNDSQALCWWCAISSTSYIGGSKSG